MNQLTQSNAANAEENAAASEELSAQASSQAGVVRNLTALVLGRSGNGSARSNGGGGAHGAGKPGALPLVHYPAASGADPAPGRNGGLREQIEQQRDAQAAGKAPQPKAGSPAGFRDIRN
jgi:hypothetical protein